jgi:hypothetical protein
VRDGLGGPRLEQPPGHEGPRYQPGAQHPHRTLTTRRCYFEEWRASTPDSSAIAVCGALWPNSPLVAVTLLMPSTPVAYPQVVSRAFAPFRVVNSRVSAGQLDFCAGFDSRQLLTSEMLVSRSFGAVGRALHQLPVNQLAYWSGIATPYSPTRGRRQTGRKLGSVGGRSSLGEGLLRWRSIRSSTSPCVIRQDRPTRYRQLAAIQPLRKPTHTSRHVRKNHLCDLGERVRLERGSLIVHSLHSGWCIAHRWPDALHSRARSI